MPAHNRAHYGGTYPARSKVVREMAYADPSTRCWRSGLTLAEGRALWGDKVEWHAGHIIDGDPRSPLAAECEQCNTSRGATMGNLKRLGQAIVGASRRW